jgi:peptidoglycan-associated lipoprotein
MKLMFSGRILVLGIALALAVSGCKHRQPTPTPLGNGGGKTGAGPGGTSEPSGPGSAPPLTQGVGEGVKSGAADGGIVQGPGHSGWPEDASVFQADTVHFAYDSSAVRSSDHSKISSVADYLKAHPANAVKIEGHCDERGTEEYNRALGEHRALALREALVGMGIDSGRVDTISYGKDRPEDPGHNEAAWAKNRRGVFILLSPPK